MFPPVRFNISFFLVITITALAGCATPFNIQAPISAEQLPTTEQGLVVARVVQADAGSLPYTEINLVPDNVNESAEVKYETLKAVTPIYDKSAIVASPATPGTYSIASIGAYYNNGNWYYQDYIGGGPAFGQIEVQPGQITDLGTIVVYPKVNEETYREVLVRVPDSSALNVLDNYFGFFDASGMPVNRWLDDGLDDERYNNYLSAVQNPVAYESIMTNAEGDAYFLSKLGLIITRSNSGEWGLDALDTNLNLLSIAQSETGVQAVVGEEGIVFTKASGGEWQARNLPPKFMGRHAYFNAENQLVVVATSEKSVEVFTNALDSDNSEWRSLNIFNPISWWRDYSQEYSRSKAPLPKRVANVSLFSAAGKQYITVRWAGAKTSLITANGSDKTFEYDPLNWTILGEADELPVDVVFQAGNATMGRKYPGYWSWKQTSDYYILAVDGQWSEIATHIDCPTDRLTRDVAYEGACFKAALSDPSQLTYKSSFEFYGTPWFADANNGLAVVEFSRTSYGKKVERNNKIIHTTDGGASWTPTIYELPKDYCFDLIGEITTQLILACNGVTGDFFESNDLGATWRHVREHQNL